MTKDFLAAFDRIMWTLSFDDEMILALKNGLQFERDNLNLVVTYNMHMGSMMISLKDYGNVVHEDETVIYSDWRKIIESFMIAIAGIHGKIFSMRNDNVSKVESILSE